jgi:single-stranded DNA-binding protein
MNRWTRPAHRTRDPELEITSGGTEICLMRIGVNRPGRDGQAGYFAVKAVGPQAAACAQYLATAPEVAIEGPSWLRGIEDRGRRLRLPRLRRRRPGRVPGQPPPTNRPTSSPTDSGPSSRPAGRARGQSCRRPHRGNP